MKPSGIEWIGDIPDDWEVRKIATLLDNIGSGTTPPNNTDFYENGIIPWLNTGDLTDNYVDLIENKITEYALNQYSALKIFPKDSVVIAMYGATIGKLGILRESASTNQACCVMQCNDNLYFKFLFYSLYGYREYILTLSYGSGQPNISQKIIKDLRLPTPPLKTQQKIADYLDEKCGEIDATIAKQKEIIEKLKAYKQLLISETVTKGLDKSAPLKPSGIDYLGDIPSHWEIKKLKFVANFNQNTLPEDTDGQFELKYIDIGNVSSVDGIKEIQYFNFSNAPSRARRIVKYGDIIVSTVRTYLRAITSIKEDYDNCICSTGFAVITPKDNFWQDFVVYAIENESFIAQIIANSQGISYPAINVSQLENLKLAFPSVKEQKEIVDFLKTKLLEIDSIINKKQNIMQKLDTYKKSLIFEYVTGKKYV